MKTATLHEQQSPQALTPDAGAWLVASHKVEDYGRWKPAFDAIAAIKRGYGWKQSSVFAIDGDRNNVLVMEEFDTMDHAKAFAASPDLRAAMGKAGLMGPPEIHFINALARANA